MNEIFESALVILIPEVEPLVGKIRGRFDPSAAVGMLAHITILYPFPDHLRRGDEIFRELSSLVSRFPAFRFTLAELCQFPGVLYLSPEPQKPFIDLINAVREQFPDSPPYGGEFENIIPHLTIADVGSPERLSTVQLEIEKTLLASLPVKSFVNKIWLVDNRTGVWEKRARFQLGSAG